LSDVESASFFLTYNPYLFRFQPQNSDLPKLKNFPKLCQNLLKTQEFFNEIRYFGIFPFNLTFYWLKSAISWKNFKH